MSIQSIGLGHDETVRVGRPLTVTISTARKITGLGNTTVWKLIAQKKLTTVKVGRRVLVTYESLERLLNPGTS